MLKALYVSASPRTILGNWQHNFYVSTETFIALYLIWNGHGHGQTRTRTDTDNDMDKDKDKDTDKNTDLELDLELVHTAL
jgi:hypothetical protein